MNISTLSQQLNMSVQELRQKMAAQGIKVSPRQRKLDNDVARQVIEALKKEAPEEAVEVTPDQTGPKKISIEPTVVVKELAAKMQIPVVELIKGLIKNGVMAAMNEEIDFDTASIVASEFGFELELETASGENVVGSGYVADAIKKELADPKTSTQFVTRPPIVAVMGHVDHGKTTLLDTLRSTNVAGSEAGAITQHIGAYQIRHNDKYITLLDTPGHEAFTQMRARGANVTDIIILVVAADDGVKPQTVEVINRARLANVPMIIAINKIDKPEANPDRVKQQLSEHGIFVEDWGGKTIAVPLSAKEGKNLDQLLDMILLLSEVEDFKANRRGQVVGTVIESHVAKGKGPVATVLVQNGTLKIGDFLVAGSAYGKIKMLENGLGGKLREAGPGMPAIVVGLSELPQAGDIFREVRTQDEAKKSARDNALHVRSKKLLNPGIVVSGKSLNLILKADVQGSLEAIVQSLEELRARTDEVQLNIIDQSVGEVNESDILRAESSSGTVIGFSTKVSPAASALAKSKGVPIDLYNVIYELIEDITRAMVGMLSPEVIRTVTGRAKVLAIFRTESNSQIVGGRVEEGKINSKGSFVIRREGEEVGTGDIEELQRNKQPAPEVPSGSEFGTKISVTENVVEGDVLEFYTEEVKARNLDNA